MSAAKAKQLTSFYRALGATYTNTVKYTNHDFICGISWTDMQRKPHNTIANCNTLTNEWVDMHTFPDVWLS